MLLAAVLIANIFISRCSGGKYSPLLLLEHEDENIPVYESSVKIRSEDISKLSESIESFCKKKGVAARLSLLTALSVEEMGVYTSEQSYHSRIDYLDILLKIYPEYILLDTRSIGKPFDTAAVPEKYSNMDVLRKISASFEYSYILGMNQTRIRLARDDGKRIYESSW